MCAGNTLYGAVALPRLLHIIYPHGCSKVRSADTAPRRLATSLVIGVGALLAQVASGVGKKVIKTMYH